MGLSGIESSYGLSYLWISIIVLVIASYTLFKDKVTIIQQEGKYLSRGIITLGIIGLFSFILDLLFIFVDTSSPGRYIRETPSAYMTMCIVALVKLFSSIFLLHISRSTFNSLFTKNGITTLFILIFCISIMGCTSKKTGVIAVIHNADTQTYYIDVATANGDTVTAEYSDELYEKKWDKFSTDLQGMQRCDLEKTFWNKNWLITRVDGRIGIIDKMNIYRVDQLFGSQDGKLLQEQWSGNASIIVDEDTINALYTNINNISRDLIGKGMKVMLIPNDEIKEWKYLKIDSIQKDAIHFNSYFVSPKQK
jgi:DNA integrity scanning protein DisA with diadenylate cyclase activity